jgi:hypothetical protein
MPHFPPIAPTFHSEVTSMKRLLFTALCIVLVMAGIIITRGPLMSETKYTVYCAEGHIEVEMRTLDEMKSARGSNTCVKGSFDYLSDAEKLAESLGGKGADCSCN